MIKRSAPAKINLSLEITGKRPDGFHNLRSLFCPLDLCDTLEITDADAFTFTCSDPGVPADDTNLVVRAARAFGGGTLPPVRIALEKRIPHSAGLGGGSSDAASTLLLLNERAGHPRTLTELSTLGAALGSDVPFFLHQSPAWCEGRGEIVHPVTLSTPFAVLLFRPPFGVPTPWAYQHLATSREVPDFSYVAQETPVGRLINDLERPVFQKYLLLGVAKQWLCAQPEVWGALMSGSGSTVFALTASLAEAEVVRERMVAEFGSEAWYYCAEPLL